MSPVRFGLLACSNVARRRFLPALATSTHARLERLGSRDLAKANDFAQSFACAKVGSYDDLLADPDVDAVYLSTPTVEHFRWAIKAVAAGKHVLCEKPAFVNVTEAREVVAAAKQAGVRVMDGYMMRYHPQHARVRSIIVEGRIGPPRFVSGEFFYPRPPAGDFRLRPEMLGGVLHDSAGYPLLAATMALNARPTRIHCTVDLDAATGVDRQVALFVEFPEGIVAQLAAGFDLPYRARYSVTGNLGRVEVLRAYAVNADVSTVIELEESPGVSRITIEPADQFRLMIDDFACQIQGTRPHDPALEQSLLDRQCMLDAARQSLSEQRPVLIEYVS